MAKVATQGKECLMARAHYMKTSRVEHQCSKGHVIPAGQPYYWAAPGYRARKRFRCTDHPFKPSELTTSLASEPMAAVEAFEETVNAIDHDDHDAIATLEGAWDELTSAVEEYQSQRQEALDAWENGNSQLEEFVYTADAAYDEVSGHEIEEWDGDTDLLALDPESFEPEPEELDEPDPDDYDDDESLADAQARWEAREQERATWEERKAEIEQAHGDYASHVEQQIEAALDVANGLEF